MAKRKAVTKLDNIPVSPIDALCKRLDEVASRLETIWGAGVLHTLATPETSAKWCRVRDRFDAAIASGDYDAVKQTSESLTRGWLKLEEEAIAAGHDRERYKGQVWYVCDKGDIEYCVVQNELDAARLAALHPNKASSIYTLQDIVRMIEKNSVVNLPKEEAKYFNDKAQSLSEILNDKIPF